MYTHITCTQRDPAVKGAYGYSTIHICKKILWKTMETYIRTNTIQADSRNCNLQNMKDDEC
jgi:hypothetical protein